MSIFDDTVVKAKEVWDIAGKKTNDIITVQKLKMSIASLKSQLSKMYESLGRLCSDSLTGPPSVSMLELMSEIEERIAEIKQLEKKLALLRGEKICSACGTKNMSDASYCYNCGNKLSDAQPADENSDSTQDKECGCEVNDGETEAKTEAGTESKTESE